MRRGATLSFALETPRARVQPTPPASFGARLRRERERRQISIASIAESTKILGALLDGLERDDVSRWPSGFYRRAFIRAYAVAIGLDPDPVVREFVERFPDPEDSAPEPNTVAVTAAPVAVSAPERLRPPRAAVVDRSAFAAGHLLIELRDRVCALALDAFVLAIMSLGVFLATGHFWAPLAITACLYYGASILMFGNTPGVSLFAPLRRER